MLHLVLKPHRASLQAGTAETQKIFALLKVIPQARAARTRPPLAFALVMDTSGSMRDDAGNATGEATRDAAPQRAAGRGAGATKLDRMLEAGHAFLDDERLEAGDRVAVVGFDAQARVLLPLQPLADRRAAHRALEALREYSGGTKMAAGLRRAAAELGVTALDKAAPDDAAPRLARRVLLLTDGQTFDEPECRPVAARLARSNTPLIAVGVGAEYNEELLRDLAQESGGRPYHLQEIGRFREVLESEVSTSVREVVTDLRAWVACVRGVALDSVTRVYPSLAEMSMAEAVGSAAAVGEAASSASAPPLRLGNVAAGDYTVFTFEFSISGLARPASRARIARLELSCRAPGLSVGAEPFGEETPSYSSATELVVSFTGDEAAVADVDTEVLGYVQQRNADRLVQEAVHQAVTDAGGARRTLHQALGLTQRAGNPALTRMLQEALDELDRSGAISPGTRKTIALDGRTRTVRTASARGGAAAGGAADESLPSEEQIRALTGT